MPVNSLADLRTRETNVGAAGANSPSAFHARLLSDVFGLKLKVIVGYPGQTEAFFAMERGEIDGYSSVFYSTLQATKADWLPQKKIKAIVHYGPEKRAELAGVPYAPEVVSFSLAPPLRYEGDEVTDPTGIESWFQTWDGPIGLDIGEPVIEAGDDVAFCHGLTHMTGRKTDGAQVDLWFRSTVGLRRTATGWQITHEHDSTPFYMDGSGRAATDLRP